MKVVHVYKNYQPTHGGIETYIRQLAVGLTRRGVVSTVLVAAPGRHAIDEEIDGVQVIRTARWGELASTPISPALIARLRNVQADVIHVHVPYPVGELGYLLAGHKRPLVVTYHSDVVRQWWATPMYRPVIRTLLRRANAIIATSPAYAMSSPVLSHCSDRCEIVPLAVDPSRFGASGPSVESVRDRWRTERYPSLILFVGRFRAYKGLTDLIHAMPGLPARLLLVGTGPMEAGLRLLVRRLRIDEQVAFLGPVDDATLPDVYAACDIFVQPAVQRSEAFGIALLEGMASGKPVVSTEIGTGTSWVNQHGVTGLVVPPHDPSALASALRLILDDRQAASRYGLAGRMRVEAEFSEELMLNRIEAVYNRVVRA